MLFRALRQWWSSTNDQQMLAAQRILLTSLVQAPVKNVQRKHGLNVVEYASETRRKSLPTVVLLHGFGSGLGFFFRNIDPLLQSGTVGRVLLVDWLGMGGSDRPPCRRPIRGLTTCTTDWCTSRFGPSQAVDFFVQPLQNLLQDEIHVDEPLWTVGHSLGGYLLARYALSTNASPNLEKVVLASPVGFPVKPSNLLSSAQLPTAIRLVDALWSANVTPQQLVRMMGATRGRNAVLRALSGRIPHLADKDKELLAEYLFHITVAHPSGEFAMNSLLEPGMSPEMAGVFAREPLEPLFQEYENARAGTKWRVLYGDHDWMRPNEPSARQAMKYLSDGNVSIIPDAGHHLYLDNSPSFVKQILQ